MLHRFVHAVPDDAGLSGAASISKGGGGSMATRFSEPSRFLDSPGVIGVGGAGVLNVVRAGPKALGVLHPLPVLCSGWGGIGLVADFWQNTQACTGSAVGSRFSGAFALAWALASQCLGPLGLLVVVDVACLLLAPPVALGSRAGWRVSRLTHYLPALGTAPPSGGGGGAGASSSAVLGPTETCPLSSGKRWRPSSAKESAFSLP